MGTPEGLKRDQRRAVHAFRISCTTQSSTPQCDSIAAYCAGNRVTKFSLNPTLLRTTLVVLFIPPLYEVPFLFSAPQGYLAEIKRLHLPADTPKATVYQWLWIKAATVTTLPFVEMVTSPRQHRTFKEAVLWFDGTKDELRWNSGPTEQLSTEPSQTLPQLLLRRVNLHLS
ncbi:hypothetical protein [Rhodoferax sp.]|uniref:hypothetical protein n=1 Tax=Rhodoferax sp. TaxID=50421 RepID=UPI002844086A|nr:hypothetical protein [Rhodoferax sp.]MDR3368826.1 hypothetical protein [Rhodoferax sp.]